MTNSPDGTITVDLHFDSISQLPASGWYTLASGHMVGNPNYIVGYTGGTYRNFLAFDLSEVSGEVTAATLTVRNNYNCTVAGGGVLTLYEVDTAVRDLLDGNSSAIWEDLGSGTVYASTVIEDSTAESISVELNGDALAAIQAKIGDGLFAIGGAYAANVESGYLFGCSGGDPGAARLVLTAEQPTYPLKIQYRGDGTGAVTGTANGIPFEWESCAAAECTANVPVSATVVLTETPSSNMRFNGWGIVCTGTSPTCTFTMNAAKTVAATFGQAQYPLAVTMAGAGVGTVMSNAVEGAQIACTTGSTTGCNASFPAGSGVTLSASYDPSLYVFQGWSGSGCSGTAACSVTMAAAKAVTATFAPATYALTVKLYGSGSGTVTGPGIDCTKGSTEGCSAPAPNGDMVTLQAVPGTGSILKSWSGCASVSGSSCTVKMTAAKTVAATFEPATYPLTVSITRSGGTVSGTAGAAPIVWKACGPDPKDASGTACTADIANGASVTLAATANTGFTFTGWGVVCTGKGTCSFKMNAAKNPWAMFSVP